MSRPPFKPTPAMKQKVAVAAGGGMSHEEIAIGLGISRPTLEKHFAFELSHGAYAKRLEVLQAMQRAAKKGNVAAQKAYMQLTPAIAVPTQEAGEGKVPKLGKKEQAAADAVTAADGTSWGDILPRPGTSLQ